jgi:CMP-N,N'-diacetyllegionaminic acid synthase
MNILFVTLARGGSKGVPYKHVVYLGTKPVLAWTILAVKASDYYNQNYVVSSDDEAILEIARAHHVTAIRRPPELALDTTPTLPALQHAIETAEKLNDTHYDYVVEVRATSPFKISYDIDEVVRMLAGNDVDSVIGVTALDDHHPMRAKWLDNGYIRDFIPEPESGRRQDCQPKAYIRNGTIYGLRTPVVKLFGHEKSLAYVMPAERSLNIDTPMDLIVCKAMVNNGLRR